MTSYRIRGFFQLRQDTAVVVSSRHRSASCCGEYASGQCSSGHCSSDHCSLGDDGACDDDGSATENSYDTEECDPQFASASHVVMITEGSEGFYPDFGLQSSIPTWRLEGIQDVLVKLGRNMEMLSTPCCCDERFLDLTKCLFRVRSVDELIAIATVINSYVRWVLDTQTHSGEEEYHTFRLAKDSIQYELCCDAALWSTATASVRLDDLLILDYDNAATTIDLEVNGRAPAHSRDYLLSIKYLMSFAQSHNDLASASSCPIFVT